MMLYVTGPAGAGKSTICDSLNERGIEAHDLDAPHLGAAYDIDKNQRVEVPPPSIHRDSAWHSKHEWRIEVDAIKNLHIQSLERPIVICGVAEQDAEILPLFDRIMYLSVTQSTLQKRLTERTDNNFGKTEGEMQLILTRKSKLDQRYLSNSDIVIVDGEQETHRIIDQIASIIAE